MGLDSKRATDPVHQLLPADLEGSGHPDLMPSVNAEPLRRIHPEHPGQHGVVADLRMQVQGGVRCVQRDSALDELPNPPTVSARQRLNATPEQSVVHQEEVGSPLGSCVNGCLTGVHCRHHMLHRAVVLDLEPVDGVGLVSDLRDAQIVV